MHKKKITREVIEKIISDHERKLVHERKELLQAESLLRDIEATMSGRYDDLGQLFTDRRRFEQNIRAHKAQIEHFELVIRTNKEQIDEL